MIPWMVRKSKIGRGREERKRVIDTRHAFRRLKEIGWRQVLAHSLKWLLALPGIAFWSMRTGRLVVGRVSFFARTRGWRNIKIGFMCEIDRGALLVGNVSLGRFCQVNQNAVLRGKIDIGNYVMIANNVTIVSGDHDFGDTTVPIRFQGASSMAIHIEDDVWIGASSTICKGVTLARGTVVGAGSVVTRSSTPYSVLAGVPARIIGQRHWQQQAGSTK